MPDEPTVPTIVQTDAPPAAEPTVTPTSETQPAPGEDVEQPWYQNQSEDLHEKLSKFKTQDDMIKSHFELEEQMSEIRPAVPENVEGYQYEPGEGIDIDANMMNAFKADALKMGISADAFPKLMQSYEGVLGQQAEMAAVAEKEVYDSTSAKLNEEWGDNYEQRMGEVQATIQKYGVADLLVQKGLGNDYEVMKMFDNLTSRMGEDNPPEGTNTGMTWDERADSLRDKIDSYPESHPDRKRYETQLDKMYKQRFPG